MCPTLEQILSRSLMRGKMPGVAGSAAAATSSSSTSSTLHNLSPIPSLRVPTLRSPHSKKPGDEAARSTKPQLQQQQPQNRRPGLAEQDLAAFAGLSTSVFEEDSRETIRERPEPRGLRSLQDLSELVRTACALGEHQSALQALKEGFVLAAKEISNTSAGRAGSSVDVGALLPQLLPVGHLTSVAACVKDQTGSIDAFEDFLDSALFEQQKNSQQQQQQQRDAEAEGKSADLRFLQEEIAIQWSDMGTEALVNSGSWIEALKRYEVMCAEGRGSVGSLNACINGLTAPKQWEAALVLAAPAIERRRAEQLNAAVASVESANKGGEDVEEKDADDGASSSSSSSALPLSRRGASDDESDASKSQPQRRSGASSSSSSSSSSDVTADAITFAALVSTLESCGRPVEARAVLESAPRAERDAVMASYVALLQVWGERQQHSFKLKRRF